MVFWPPTTGEVLKWKVMLRSPLMMISLSAGVPLTVKSVAWTVAGSAGSLRLTVKSVGAVPTIMRPQTVLATEQPVGVSRAMRLRGWPPMNWKSPPTRILPSACTAMAKTKSFALGSKLASSEPSELSRAMRLRVWPPMADRTRPPESCRRPAPQRHGPDRWRWGQSWRRASRRN